MKTQLPAITHETVVFTKHARERLGLRRLGEDMIIQVMRNPKQTQQLEDGKIKFIGKTGGARVHAICKPVLEENKWLVITLWVRGEDDAGNFVNRGKSYKRTRPDFLTQFFYGLLALSALLLFIFLQQRFAG